jgi:hypothetical protein
VRSTILAALVVSLVPLLVGTVAQAQDVGQGAIVVRDTAHDGLAPIYAHEEGSTIESQASQNDLVAGITTPHTVGLTLRETMAGLFAHTYVFETSHDRIHVVYFPNGTQPGRWKMAWMDPADLQTFTYDCSCGARDFHGLTSEACAPFSPSGFLKFKWNECFTQGRDQQLAQSGQPGVSPGAPPPNPAPIAEAGTDANSTEDQPLSPDVITKRTGGGASDAPPGDKGKESESPSPKKSRKTLTNEDVIKLVKAELGDKVIIDKIHSSPGDKLDTSTDALIRLKKAGVSKAVIDAIVKRADE